MASRGFVTFSTVVALACKLVWVFVPRHNRLRSVAGIVLMLPGILVNVRVFRTFGIAFRARARLTRGAAVRT